MRYPARLPDVLPIMAGIATVLYPFLVYFGLPHLPPGPLVAVALGMIVLGPVAYIVRRRGRTFAANLLIAAAMVSVLMAAHAGLVRFYPILGSRDLAEAIKADGLDAPVLIDGELTSGSSLQHAGTLR